MEWNSKLLKTIQIWFGCTNRANRDAQLAFKKTGFAYQIKETNLGFEGSLDEIGGNIKIVLSYTVRDGMFVNIKVLNPWKIIFEYSDGAYFVNDPNVKRYDKLIKALKNLQASKDKGNYCRIYAQLELIVLEHLQNLQHTI